MEAATLGFTSAKETQHMARLPNLDKDQLKPEDLE
jgi:hypothetical protein